jgi:hydroxyacylglutathione hydrolase
MAIVKHIGGHSVEFEPTANIHDQDMIITEDNDTFLRSIGIEGKIIVTPGHSDDSISLALDDGRFFTGDLNENWLKFTGAGLRPIHLTDEDELIESWGKIIDIGAKHIYPGHGTSFGVDELQAFKEKIL